MVFYNWISMEEFWNHLQMIKKGANCVRLLDPSKSGVGKSGQKVQGYVKPPIDELLPLKEDCDLELLEDDLEYFIRHTCNDPWCWNPHHLELRIPDVFRLIPEEN